MSEENNEENDNDIIIQGTLYTPPKTKGRPRLTRSGKAYNPESTRLAQRTQALFFKGFAHKSGKKFPIPRKTPLEVHLRFIHAGKKPFGPKMTTPDIDNLCKLTLDAITDSGIWNDDSQITKMIMEDLWAGPEGKSRIEFCIKKHLPTVK